MTRPNVQMVWVNQEGCLTVGFINGSGGHPKLQIFVGNIRLLIVHPEKMRYR